MDRLRFALRLTQSVSILVLVASGCGNDDDEPCD